jgi:mono/diheme cytochrome c family protein
MRALRLGFAACLLAAAAGAWAGDDAAHARLQFLQHCSGCHLPDGSGSPAHGVPSMRGVLGEFLRVPGGREFIVQVPGVMNSALPDAEIARLMNWLLRAVSAETLPADLAPYTEQEIARLRGSRPADILAARAALVHRMKDAQAR